MEKENLTERNGKVPDVTKMHEHPDALVFPKSHKLERSVLFAAGFVLFSVFVGGSYLGRYNGGFRNDVYELQAVGSANAGKASATVEAPFDPVAYGQKQFNLNCASCHQSNGQGVAGQYPPLAGSEWVIGPSKRVSAIVLNGLEGSVTVKGGTYNGAMASWKSTLNDKKLSSILTFIRQAWGNTATAITEEQMAAFRTEFGGRNKVWSEAELKQIAD